jgi:pimeloyl-ACP methyl ester carboxylesterase
VTRAPATLVYVHGLWLTGRESLVLRRRLERELGFDVRAFHYPSVTASTREIADQLQRFVHELAPRRLHLVGHSLGGLVIYRFLERFPAQPPGRVVFLGAPTVASHAAQRASRLRWARVLLGRAVAEELLHAHERRWVFDRDLGIIAGTRPMGLGRLFTRFDEPSDGTVAVAETQLPGATEHLTLPVTHSGMLLSARVARAAGHFLEQGRFPLAGRRTPR